VGGIIGDQEFTFYWVCGEHRVPLEVRQIGGAGDSWHVYGGGYCILDLYHDDKGNIYCIGNDWLAEDIWAVVELITEFTGVSYNDVLFYREKYPTSVGRFPPYFKPVFRDKRHKISYYRTKWKEAQKDLDWQKELKK